MRDTRLHTARLRRRSSIRVVVGATAVVAVVTRSTSAAAQPGGEAARAGTRVTHGALSFVSPAGWRTTEFGDGSAHLTLDGGDGPAAVIRIRLSDSTAARGRTARSAADVLTQAYSALYPGRMLRIPDARPIPIGIGTALVTAVSPIPLPDSSGTVGGRLAIGPGGRGRFVAILGLSRPGTAWAFDSDFDRIVASLRVTTR
jgi:hypothetical protein